MPRIIALLLALMAVSNLCAQRPVSAPSHEAQAQQMYSQSCAGCHGADFLGTDQGPALKANEQLREMS